MPPRLAVFFLSFAALVASAFSATAAAPASRWSLAADGAIEWKPKADELHADNIEMSGLQVSVIVDYKFEKPEPRVRQFTVERQVIWPLLRFNPNDTHAHFALTFREDAMPRVFVDRRLAAPAVARLEHKGVMQVEGTYGRNRELAFTRTIFPSADQPAVFDRTRLTNTTEKDVVLEIEPNDRRVRTNPERGVYGSYVATAAVLGAGQRTLKPGESTEFTLVLSARKADEPAPAFDVAAQESARRARVQRVLDELQLDTPDRVLNTAFAFAKIRATESIYATKGGLMHGPGGGKYYAALWANDQAEYANPFFAMLADPTARESALNAYRHFARFMNPEFKPIPSSIIAEGADIWHGAGDRGDMAMIAYGASRFALARGDRAIAQELWPLITWCLDYCRRKVNADGVVESDADELENRFPAGKANLCTAALYYDALLSSALLARELGHDAKLAADFEARAKDLRGAIERYFGRNVEGFDTYRYFDKAVPAVRANQAKRHARYAGEPDHLRAWICIPLTVGIHERAKGTIDALFSPRLWTPDGLATEAGKEDFWDRSTLYALRGVFAAGETQRALDYLIYYSNRRLLGDHVPYPIEAWPENNQRHLSAESALYARIFTEGMFGLRPTGLKSFTVTPRLPKGWPAMALKNVNAFGQKFDLSVKRTTSGQLEVTTRDRADETLGGMVTQIVADGETVAVKL